MFLPAVGVVHRSSCSSVGGYAWTLARAARAASRRGLSARATARSRCAASALLVFLLASPPGTSTSSRGVGVMFLFFLLLVVVMNFALTRTRWGRAVYAVGGNVEAARRAGIRVNRDLHLGLRAVLDPRGGRRHPRRGAARARRTRAQRRRRHQPQRDRGGRDRRREPVRRTRVGVLRACSASS